jgi:ATP-dependent DNA helicase RecQ
MDTPRPDPVSRELKDVIARHWGFSALRPLQERAMRAVLAGRDSLVVMPTGGGKSLCYQAPATLRESETTVVVSPLIALMKDQVDGLLASGIPAVQIDSSQTDAERAGFLRGLKQRAVRMVFVSPERLTLSGFQRVLQQANVRTFAIDEAHCISHWGHDFRPEYRQLQQLREMFPAASFHAYTATATERVRADIITQLGLKNPDVLVGDFDRPILTYRVLPKHEMRNQVLEVLGRHKGEAGIIYCIRRKDVDDLTEWLRARGHAALPYHAGMSADDRQASQDAFAEERCDLIVATVAFGMGIDRSNIRFVMHTGIPKSIEHYQQEAGRAGRDGLEAECVLLYSGGDFMTWKKVTEKSAHESGAGPDFLRNALAHLEEINAYGRVAVCRHKTLVEHFGQSFAPDNCKACDVCLGDVETDPDAVVTAQKILSCVARVKESFGIGHVVSVLRGENTEKVRKFGHDQLSTYGLLRDMSAGQLKDWIHQLLGQGVLVQSDGEYPLLRLNPASWEVMARKRTVRLLRPKKKARPERSLIEVESWEGIDSTLFDRLRGVRRVLAVERQVPAYLIFSDATLREMCKLHPKTREQLRRVTGVGETKLRDFGDKFLEVLADV